MTLNNSFSVNVLDIHIRSEGCNDPNKTPNTCGIAFIYVNGVDRSPRKRGHNVVVLNGRTGNIGFIEITKALFAFPWPLPEQLFLRLSCDHNILSLGIWKP